LRKAASRELVGALRSFQTTFVHHISHGNGNGYGALTGYKVIDALIGEALSVVAWIQPLSQYLRLCFRFGGFPGYDGATTPPPEIETLRESLVAF
jgi:hypothetical protein